MPKCNSCSKSKPRAAFFTDSRTPGKLRPKCKACCQRAWKKPTRTPAQRAEYRRRDGLVKVPYIPAAKQRAQARIHRAGRTILVAINASQAWAKQVAASVERAARCQFPPHAWGASSSAPARIRLMGRHAVGQYRYALVDSDMLPLLSRWKWKAKPNARGTGVYAVRTVLIDGRWKTERMHRVVCGLERSNPMEPDHLNWRTLDNRRCNLVVGSRSANCAPGRRSSVAH